MAVKLFQKKAPFGGRAPGAGACPCGGRWCSPRCCARWALFSSSLWRAGGWNGPGTPCTSSTSPPTTPMKWKRENITPFPRTAPSSMWRPPCPTPMWTRTPGRFTPSKPPPPLCLSRRAPAVFLQKTCGKSPCAPLSSRLPWRSWRTLVVLPLENQKAPGHPQPSCPENRTERFGLPRGVPQRRRAGQAVPVL